LQGAVKKNKRKTPWLYVAAAAAVVAIVTTLFLLPAKKTGEVIAKAPDSPSIQKSQPDSVKKNKINLPGAPKKQNETAVIKKNNTCKKNTRRFKRIRSLTRSLLLLPMRLP
jgi:hypothetical protein